MLKKIIKYTDYNDVEREEPFYFNLTKAELAEMDLLTEGGLENRIKKIIAAKDIAEVSRLFKEIILKSYGVKSDDGKRFIKKPEITEDFTFTEAYSNLYMELASDEEAAIAFINGIIPKDLSENI